MTHQIARGALRRFGVPLAGGVLAIGGVAAVSTPAFAAAPVGPFTIGGSLGIVLYPGVGGPLDLSFTNPNDVVLQLVQLDVHIDSVVPAACALTNFAVDQYSPPVGLALILASHSSTTLSGLGLTTSQLPQVRMLETGVAQDECQGASVHLVYTGTALGPNGQVSGGGDSGDHDHDGHDHDGHDHDGHDGSDDDNVSGSDLPGTGGSGHEGGLTAAGLGLVGAGAAITWIVRRRKGVQA